MSQVAFILVVLVYFIIVVVFLTILWRMALALDLIAQQLSEMARDLKKLSSNIDDRDKD